MNSISLKTIIQNDEKRTSLLKKYKEKNQIALEKDYARSNLMYDTLKKHFGDKMTYKSTLCSILELRYLPSS
jgi:hypothetical protein